MRSCVQELLLGHHSDQLLQALEILKDSVWKKVPEDILSTIQRGLNRKATAKILVRALHVRVFRHSTYARACVVEVLRRRISSMPFKELLKLSQTSDDDPVVRESFARALRKRFQTTADIGSILHLWSTVPETSWAKQEVGAIVAQDGCGVYTCTGAKDHSLPHQELHKRLKELIATIQESGVLLGIQRTYESALDEEASRLLHHEVWVHFREIMHQKVQRMNLFEVVQLLKGIGVPFAPKKQPNMFVRMFVDQEFRSWSAPTERLCALLREGEIGVELSVLARAYELLWWTREESQKVGKRQLIKNAVEHAIPEQTPSIEDLEVVEEAQTKLHLKEGAVIFVWLRAMEAIVNTVDSPEILATLHEKWERGTDEKRKCNTFVVRRLRELFDSTHAKARSVSEIPPVWGDMNIELAQAGEPPNYIARALCALL